MVFPIYHVLTALSRSCKLPHSASINNLYAVHRDATDLSLMVESLKHVFSTSLFPENSIS
jgi:hypothetical protein